MNNSNMESQIKANISLISFAMSEIKSFKYKNGLGDAY
uniref:Uncharacterized protein n=1 Tax=viral metagenome TaxID=1070528 RepID=A0A6C0JX50_9ZZZZ